MFRRSVKLPISKELFTSLISGSEAGIATTAAIIVGLAIGTDDRQVVVISAIIAVTIQAFNSAITTIVTAHTIDEIEHNRDMDSLLRPMTEAGLQFLTHMITGLIVLAPIAYITSFDTALLTTIGVALTLLLLVGLIVGRIARHRPLRNSIHSFTLGMLIIIGGFLAGYIIN